MLAQQLGKGERKSEGVRAQDQQQPERHYAKALAELRTSVPLSTTIALLPKQQQQATSEEPVSDTKQKPGDLFSCVISSR